MTITGSPWPHYKMFVFSSHGYYNDNWGGRKFSRDECKKECKALWEEFHRGTLDVNGDGTYLNPKKDWLIVKCQPQAISLKPCCWGFNSQKDDDFFVKNPSLVRKPDYDDNDYDGDIVSVVPPFPILEELKE